MGEPRFAGDIVADIRRQFATVTDQPEIPHHFVARHDVPLGKIYRYWDTRGRLIVYVNRAVIEALPKRRWGPLDIYEAPIMAANFGIPVIMEEVE